MVYGFPSVANNVAFKHISHWNLLKNANKKWNTLSSISIRKVYNDTGIWVKKYKKATRIDVEKYWAKHFSETWKQTDKYKENLNEIQKFYCLSMFPYPSGKLHMGHVRVYTISDTMAHFHRMQGKEVIHPMGWDSFGLPAENAAINNKLDPEEWTKKNITDMKQQLIDLDLLFDWNRELSTCSPAYYKWTQYLFVRLFESGLAYRKKALVNWDPVDNTVLANEQVDDEGRSWRSGALVEKRFLKQWFLRTSKYAESLLNTIDEVDEHVGIKAMQRNWIGNIEGCFIDLKLLIDGSSSEDSVSVFCSHPELITSATHINLDPQHSEEFALVFNDAGGTVNSSDLNKSKNGQLLQGVCAINPFSNETIPFVVSDHYSEVFKTSAVIGLPSVNKTDASIATRNSWNVDVIQEPLSREEALRKIRSIGCGHDHMTSSKIGDWLISRQRRWGTPIPVVYCPEHGAVCVPEDELPVVLPKYNEDLENWKQTTCPKCGEPAIRETDTMDTFVDSSWYFMRYTDPHNQNEIFSSAKCNKEMPVDLYIGGKEHAILHLYYARFISHFCNDIGLTVHREPFKKLLAQGIIKGKTYRLKGSGKYLPVTDVEENDFQGSYFASGRVSHHIGNSAELSDFASLLNLKTLNAESGAYERSTGEVVETSFEKMSKSKLNGVDPLEFVSEWGISLTRLFVLYAASPAEIIHWDTKTDTIPGVMRWQMKLWKNVGRLMEARKNPPRVCEDFDTEFNMSVQTNRIIEQVTHLYSGPCILSAAITFLMTLARHTVNVKDHVIPSSREFERSVCAQVIMSAPMMPHFASELWSGLRGMKYKMTEFDWDKDVLSQSWPKVEEVAHTPVEVWVNKKCCVKLYLPRDFDDKTLPDLALKHPKVFKRIKDPVAETIVKPNYVKFLTKATATS